MVGLFPLKAEIVNRQLNYKNVSFFIYCIFVLIRVEAAMVLKRGSEKESARILGQAINCIHSHVFCLAGKIWHTGSQIRVCRQRHASKQEDVGTVLSNYSLCLCTWSSAFNFTQCCGSSRKTYESMCYVDTWCFGSWFPESQWTVQLSYLMDWGFCKFSWF